MGGAGVCPKGQGLPRRLQSRTGGGGCGVVIQIDSLFIGPFHGLKSLRQNSEKESMKDPNYPWREHFPVLDADYKHWEAEKSGDGLLFHALQKNLINRKKYFNWAMEYYQMPLLGNDFFEYAIMGKTQWKQVKDLREWSREVLPVWEWEGTIYVGCMEPPKDGKGWTFPHRLLLVTDLALKMRWKAVRSFSDLPLKADGRGKRPTKKTKSAPALSFSSAGAPATAATAPSPPAATPPAGHTTAPSPSPSSAAATPAPATGRERMGSLQPATAPAGPLATGGLPEEALSPPAPDPLGEPVRETSPPEGGPDSSERDSIIPLNLSPDPAIPVVEKPAENLKAVTVSEKTGIIKLSGEDGFSELQKKLKKDFAGILLLKNRDSLLYPEKWAGRIQIENSSKPLISLKTISIFSVLLKGFDYHGFVVENESNVKLFQDINWPVLPKHITAVPFSGPDQKLDRVFLGVAIKSLSHKKLGDIKNTVLPFFEETGQKQAA